tara:strand:- start:11607 stop:12593 length:987 start_codon:yes stop_codon:yes gene_type:complete
MSLLNFKEQLIEHFSRAPSVHNTQPFRFKFSSDSLSIFDDPNRILQVGDTDERDHELSLGAMIESCHIVLNGYGFDIKEIALLCDVGGPLRRRAILAIVSSDKTNDLFSLFLKRKSYRGEFPQLPILEQGKLLSDLENVQNLKVLGAGEQLANWAKWYDQASFSFMHNNSYLSELYSWMRFTKRHPDYLKDGLNAKAMSLNGIEAWFAQFVMKPSIFSFLKTIGLGRTLVSEAPQINSSLAVVAVTAPIKTSRVEQGRIFLRTWLELTRIGLSATPLSALVDEPKSYQAISHQLESDVVLVNVMRVGKISSDHIYKSPRLPVHLLELK